MTVVTSKPSRACVRPHEEQMAGSAEGLQRRVDRVREALGSDAASAPRSTRALRVWLTSRAPVPAEIRLASSSPRPRTAGPPRQCNSSFSHSLALGCTHSGEWGKDVGYGPRGEG